MTSHTSIEELLRWRLECALAEAPPAPRAARLLALARPWWETVPERFRDLLAQVEALQPAIGHAMTDAHRSGTSHPVPVVIARGSNDDDFATVAHVLFIQVRNGMVRLRFQLQGGADSGATAYDATFVSSLAGHAPFEATAIRSVDHEYRVESEISPALEPSWSRLRVTDPMPFRLILRPPVDGSMSPSPHG